MKKYQIAFVFFLALFSFRFYEAHFIDKSILNTSHFVVTLIAILISLPYFISKRKVFVLPVQLIVVSVILSIFMAYISWEQSFLDSLIETAPYMIWIFFFYLLHLNISVKTVEKIILFYGVVYTLLYFFQLANSSTIFFGTSLSAGNEYSVDRGISRIIFPGGGMFVLTAFMALNKFTTKEKGKWLWFLFAILGIVIPVLQVTRMFIAGMLLIYLYHFIQKESFYKKALIMAGFVGVTLFVANYNNQLIKGMKQASVNDAKRGQDYVRVLSSTYFLTDFSPNIISRVFGNGAPRLATSEYGHTVQNLNERKTFYLEDDGIVGMYAMFGVLPVIAYIMIWYKSFTLKLPKEYYFVKYYLWFLLITCLTTYNVYYPFYLISTVFALYIYQVIYERQFQSSVKLT